MNKRVENDFGIIEREFSAFPKNAKYVLESSSVWYGIYQKLVGDLGLDVVLSNPYLTRLIAKSKKKIDRFDAHSSVVKNSNSFFLTIGNNFLENLSESLIWALHNPTNIPVRVNKFTLGFYGMCNSVLERGFSPPTGDQLYPWRVLRGDLPDFSNPASFCSIRSPPRGSPFFPARKPSGCARWGQAG